MSLKTRPFFFFVLVSISWGKKMHFWRQKFPSYASLLLFATHFLFVRLLIVLLMLEMCVVCCGVGEPNMYNNFCGPIKWKLLVVVDERQTESHDDGMETKFWMGIESLFGAGDKKVRMTWNCFIFMVWKFLCFTFFFSFLPPKNGTLLVSQLIAMLFRNVTHSARKFSSLPLFRALDCVGCTLLNFHISVPNSVEQKLKRKWSKELPLDQLSANCYSFDK